MIAVSDTGPIIGLAKANHLSLLKDLFGKVLIPPIVHKELFAKTGNEWELIDNALMDFIKISEIHPIDETANSIKVALNSFSGVTFLKSATFTVIRLSAPSLIADCAINAL